jgi:hypothetical protein
VDRQLLRRELWLGSGGAADWWARQRCFASSAAAMSMVSLKYLVPACWLFVLRARTEPPFV